MTALIHDIDALEVRGDPGTTEIRSVEFDSRRVEAGSLFCCLPGTHADGHNFAAEAVGRGATAILCERLLDLEVTQVRVAPGALRPSMATVAAAFYGHPSRALRMVGVTGTNGKTTVTHLVRAVLEHAGIPTGLIGTLAGERTTPESPDLQRRLAEFRDEGRQAVALEVSSHALAQHRLDGYRHNVAVFTNLSQDHLDYHGTMEAYFATKELLFRPEHAVQAVVNLDDEFGRRLLQGAAIPMGTFSLDQADGLEVGLLESRFRLEGEPVHLRLGGKINVKNALAAAAAARVLGVPASTIAAGLSAAEGPAGRLEAVPNSLGAKVVVDYAHTPAGLSEILQAARAEAAGNAGRVIVVFGCGGDRDRDKRPMMGSIATHYSDIAVLTSDNPRNEDPLGIIEQVVSGCDGNAQLVIEPDRRLAIAEALGAARTGDVVVVAGKGHENHQEIGGVSIEFSDREVITEELAALARKGAGK